jgi:hypothetical protein
MNLRTHAAYNEYLSMCAIRRKLHVGKRLMGVLSGYFQDFEHVIVAIVVMVENRSTDLYTSYDGAYIPDKRLYSVIPGWGRTWQNNFSLAGRPWLTSTIWISIRIILSRHSTDMGECYTQHNQHNPAVADGKWALECFERIAGSIHASVDTSSM